MDDQLIQFVSREIERYLAVRPDSADTLEGIHQWWIKWPGPAESMAVTVAALTQLEEAGVVQALRVGNREIWRRRPST